METIVKRRGRPPKKATTPKEKSVATVQESRLTRKRKQSGKVNSVKKQHRCKECHNSFGTKSSLTLHMHTHNGVKSFTCKICGSTYAKQSTLRTHMRSHVRGANGQEHVCSVCNKTFAHSQNLRMHMNRHTGSRPYKCKDVKCDAAFADAGTLRRHRITVHSNNTPYKCKQCDAKFKRKDYLETHLRRIDHKGPAHKPAKSPKKNKVVVSYSCEECSAKFMQRRDFVKHVKRVHPSIGPPESNMKLEPAELNDGSEEDIGSDPSSRKDPYVCEQCNGEFDHRRDLRRHIKVIHGSEWLYICDICEIAFKHKGHLQKHNAIHSS